MEDKPTRLDNYILKLYGKFEKIIAISVSLILAMVILIAFVRIVLEIGNLLVHDFTKPSEILYQDFQDIFGKIMTLLISLEFMSSVVNIIRSHSIKKLLEDVVLIAALAVTRKLITYDYEHHDAQSIISLGVILLCLGLLYFFLRYERRQQIKQKDTTLENH